METSSLPRQWQDAFRRDLESPPRLPDPLPERRLARLLAVFIAAGLFFMVLPGTILGVSNLVGISSQRRGPIVAGPLIQAHGHAQLFGWVGTFIIGISLYTLPKFRGALCRSIPGAWAVWAMWIGGVALRCAAGFASAVHPDWFRAAAALELAAGLLVLWEVTASPGPSHKQGQAWEAPIFAGFGALLLLLGRQLWLTIPPLAAPALPEAEDRTLISLAVWGFAFPLVLGYSAKFFPGLMGAPPAHRVGIRLALGGAAVAATGFLLDSTVLAGAGALVAAVLASWSLRLYRPPAGTPKTTGVYHRYPQFVRVAYAWLAVAAALGFGAARPGMLGASRHAFTVGFLATLIFSIGPRILPSFANSRELWSPRLMKWSLALLTAGCALRVVSEPLAYSGAATWAWHALPPSAFAELTAVLLFGCNIAMSLATPVPSWFGRRQVHERMSVYWLVSSYPGTRRLLARNGLATLDRARSVPKSLSLREAAEADGVSADALVEKLGDFFDARLAPAVRRAGDERPPQ